MIEAWTFAVAAGLILYTYLGYPVVLRALTAGRRPPVYDEPAAWPAVSLIITAYNEEAVLPGKLDNTLALDYPADRLQVVLVSDGSTDGTDELARSCAQRHGFAYLRQEVNAGKTAAQNAGVGAATGALLVFSDANSLYRPDAVKRLVTPFADPAVGCVCGQLRYRNPQRAGAGKGEGSYWRYEQFLKRRESLLGSLVGANGAIYALRRELFEALDAALISDFVLPVRVRRRGHRVVYEPAAVAEEESARGFGAELKRRRRIVARSVYGLWRERGALNPLRHPLFAFQIASHKVVRWTVPVLLLAMLAASAGPALGRLQPWAALFAVQLTFYGLALVGAAFPHGPGRLSPFYVPAYFCAINLGALLGLVGALTGRRHTVWTPVARPGRSA